MESVTLRKADESDKPQLFELNVSLFRDQIDKIWGWDTAQQVEIFEREWSTSSVRIIVFEESFAGVIQQREHDDHTFLLNFAVDTPYQSLGIGSHLIERLKAEVKSAKRVLRLNVFKTNARARNFYLRHGFSTERQGENGWGMIWEADDTH